MNHTRTPLFALALAAITVSACSTTSNESNNPTAERKSINANVDASLDKLYREAPGSRELIGRAKGVLVFPSVVSAGFIVGASYGKGELLAGTQSAGYYSTAAGSVGLLAGAESKSVFVLFMTQQAYDQFVASQGWTAGVDASVTLINMGADGSIDTRTANTAAVESLVLNNGGLMANLSIDGTKFTRLSL
jgi:lipid-binding SYLF domain-containing protein